MKILITGSCGFIGFHLSLSLLKKKHEIYGFDTLNDYYDKKLKISRLKILQNNKNFNFYKYDISNKKIIDKFFNKNKIDIIINLAAYAGVQYSLKNPDIYFKTNEIGFYNILENAKKHRIKRLFLHLPLQLLAVTTICILMKLKILIVQFHCTQRRRKIMKF